MPRLYSNGALQYHPHNKRGKKSYELRHRVWTPGRNRPKKFKGWQLLWLISKNSNVSSKGPDHVFHLWNDMWNFRKGKSCSFSDEGPLLVTLEFFEISHSSYQPLNFFLSYLTLSTQYSIFKSLYELALYLGFYFTQHAVILFNNGRLLDQIFLHFNYFLLSR